MSLALPFPRPVGQPWDRVTKFDAVGAALADRHYSRRTVGSNQFMPPGQTVVLLGDRSVFGWWRPDPAAGIVPANGLDGWTCTIFRNEGPELSSWLIVKAEEALLATEEGKTCGPDGLLSYVWPAKLKGGKPGYCFIKAGWYPHPFRPLTVDGKKILFTKPWAYAGCLI